MNTLKKNDSDIIFFFFGHCTCVKSMRRLGDTATILGMPLFRVESPRLTERADFAGAH